MTRETREHGTPEHCEGEITRSPLRSLQQKLRSALENALSALDKKTERINFRQFSVRAMLIGILGICVVLAVVKRRMNQYDEVARAQKDIELFDPDATVDFFRTTLENKDLRSLNLHTRVNDEQFLALVKKHPDFFNMMWQLSFEDGDLSEESFQRIAEFPELETLNLWKGDEVTLAELKPLQDSKTFRYLAVLHPNFSDEDLARLLPNVQCTTHGVTTSWSQYVFPEK